MLDTRLARWISSNDTGRSSLAIVSHLNGAEVRPSTHPLDPADLGRCLRLLSLIPEYRARLPEMKTVSPEWNVLVEHWGELEKLYYEGLASKGKRAPKCYDRMKELLESVRELNSP